MTDISDLIIDFSINTIVSQYNALYKTYGVKTLTMYKDLSPLLVAKYLNKIYEMTVIGSDNHIKQLFTHPDIIQEHSVECILQIISQVCTNTYGVFDFPDSLVTNEQLFPIVNSMKPFIDKALSDHKLDKCSRREKQSPQGYLFNVIGKKF